MFSRRPCARLTEAPVLDLLLKHENHVECIWASFGSLARVPLAKFGWRYLHLIEMFNRCWVPLLVLLLGDLPIAGADKAYRPRTHHFRYGHCNTMPVSADLNRLRRQPISSMSFRYGP